jgi:antitoxin component of MazEF toxin-antitoxin module
MSNKRLKVYRKPGCESDAVPEMRIRGVWLTKLGFNVGDHIELSLENKQIVIRPERIPNMVEEAPGTEIPE